MLIASIRKSTKLDEKLGLYAFEYNNQPILKVEIAGVLISILVREKKSSYIIDDGTGAIECVKYHNSNMISAFASFGDMLEIGDTVCVQGNLVLAETNVEDYGFMVVIASIEKADDPNFETFHWVSCLNRNL